MVAQRRGVSEIVIRPVAGAAEFPAPVEICRSGVAATDDFLADAARDESQAHLASDYFPAVELVAASLGGEVVGFAGTLEGNLEMLFVDAAHRGSGLGSALLAHVIAEHAVTRVDVNEQNIAATGFYLHRRFEVAGRSEFDEAGRPYPVLHLRLSR
jgi:putative acetyltransferase